MLSMRYAVKNAKCPSKTNGALRGGAGASGANKGYVLAHCALPRYLFRSEVESLSGVVWWVGCHI